MTPRLPPKIAVTFALAAVPVLASACGDDSGIRDSLSSEGGTRTVNIEMHENEFSPQRVDVEAGETVRFVFRNRGDVIHDAIIGDEAAQDEHEAEMREAHSGDTADGSGMDHGDGSRAEGGITVNPGERASSPTPSGLATRC